LVGQRKRKGACDPSSKVHIPSSGDKKRRAKLFWQGLSFVTMVFLRGIKAFIAVYVVYCEISVPGMVFVCKRYQSLHCWIRAISVPKILRGMNFKFFISHIALNTFILEKVLIFWGDPGCELSHNIYSHEIPPC
jgi:hypothetical protein